MRAEGEAGEYDLLDDMSVRIAQLGFERHGGGVIYPQAVAVAELIPRRNRDHMGITAIQAHARHLANVIETRRLLVQRRKTHERFAFRPLLHDHGALVRQIAGEVRAGADELAPRAVEGCQPLGHRAVLHAVNDAQHLHAPALPVRKRAVVVARGQGMIHALEPLRRRVLRSLSRQRGACKRPGERRDGELIATAHCCVRLPAVPRCRRHQARSS